MSSVHLAHLYCLELFTYHLHRYIVKCPPYIQHIFIVLNSSIITYTDKQSRVLRTSNTSLLSWTLQLSLTPIYSQVSSVHPTRLYFLELFTYHLHRYTVKCSPYIQHTFIVLNSSLITYNDIKSSVLRTSNISLLSWTLQLSLTPIYRQVSSVHPTHPYCLELFTYHLHRYTVKCSRTSNTSLLSWTFHLPLTPIYSQVFSVHPAHLYCLDLFTYHLHRYTVKCYPYIQHIFIFLNSLIIKYTDLKSSVLRPSNKSVLSSSFQLSLTHSQEHNN